MPSLGLIVVIGTAFFVSCVLSEFNLPTRSFIANGFARSFLDPSLCPPLILSGSGSGDLSSGSGSGGLSSSSGSGGLSSGSGLPDCPDPKELLCSVCSVCNTGFVYSGDICTLCDSVRCDDSSGSSSGSTFIPSGSGSTSGSTFIPSGSGSGSTSGSAFVPSGSGSGSTSGSAFAPSGSGSGSTSGSAFAPSGSGSGSTSGSAFVPSGSGSGLTSGSAFIPSGSESGSTSGSAFIPSGSGSGSTSGSAFIPSGSGSGSTSGSAFIPSGSGSGSISGSAFIPSGSGSGSISGSASIPSGSGSGSTSGSTFIPSGSGSGDQCPFLRGICQEVRSECDYPGYIGMLCNRVREVCGISPGNNGIDCERPFGNICQSIVAKTFCQFSYSDETCSTCSSYLQVCDSEGINLANFCNDVSTESCNTSDISLCFGITRSATMCDYCAYVGNECFTDSEQQLCTIKGLVEGCMQVLDSEYPCQCFFPSVQCRLCGTVSRVCAVPTTETPSTPSAPITQSTTTSTNETTPSTAEVTTSTVTGADTTMLTSTVPTLSPALVQKFEDLSDQEKQGSVTSGFEGVKKEEFIKGADKQFRDAIQKIVNKDILKINRDDRRKRQSSVEPVPVTADDVQYVSPSPFLDDNDVLQVVFFVESANDGVINGNDLAQSVQTNGAQLANTIGDSLNISVEFSGVEQGIPDTIAQLPTTTSLSAGAIVGIIIAIVAVSVLVLIVVIVVVFARKRDRKYTITTAGKEDVHYVAAGDTFTSSTGIRNESNLTDQSPVPMFAKRDGLPVTAFIETNPEFSEENSQIADDKEGVQIVTKTDMSDSSKDTHL